MQIEIAEQFYRHWSRYNESDRLEREAHPSGKMAKFGFWFEKLFVPSEGFSNSRSLLTVRTLRLLIKQLWIGHCPSWQARVKKRLKKKWAVSFPRLPFSTHLSPTSFYYAWNWKKTPSWSSFHSQKKCEQKDCWLIRISLACCEVWAGSDVDKVRVGQIGSGFRSCQCILSWNTMRCRTTRFESLPWTTLKQTL